jgi:hypothetical protein
MFLALRGGRIRAKEKARYLPGSRCCRHCGLARRAGHHSFVGTLMCNLYSITTNQAAIIALFRGSRRPDTKSKKSCPSSAVLVTELALREASASRLSVLLKAWRAASLCYRPLDAAVAANDHSVTLELNVA